MKVIGLTGGIGTGKSTVSKLLSELGATILDADKIGHEALEADCPACNEVIAAFGRGILTPEGKISRKKLGQLVFGSPELLARLNCIVHPWIFKTLKERLDGLREQGIKIAVVEAALLIEAIVTHADDVEHELRYHQLTDTTEGKWWSAKTLNTGEPSDADQIMLHYAINKPVGEVRGYSDLAQIVKWLKRYEIWLEDRVRINRYKGAYLWHVTIDNALPGQLEAKRAQYSRVPTSGSIIVTDGHEKWEAVRPNIGADQAEADGKAIRLMIAAGAGVPLHFLAEGDSATRATAREMGTATYRHFAHRQKVFGQLVRDVIQTAAQRAGHEGIAFELEFENVLAEDYRASRAESARPQGGPPDAT